MKAIRPSSKFSPPPNLVAGFGFLTSKRSKFGITLDFVLLIVLKGGANLMIFGAEGVSLGLNLLKLDVT